MNRADMRNALNGVMIGELTQAFNSLVDDERVRAIVLGGRGSAFCAGADLAWIRSASSHTEAEDQADVEAMRELLRTIDDCPKPVVARIHGACIGAGMGLAAVCDIAVASRTASFGQPETRLGLMPALTAPYVVRAMSLRAAQRWLLTGETFGANEAWRIGFVHDVCNLAELDPRIDALLGGFMMSSAPAVQGTKALLRTLC
ncbi:enoyl-CoA hydratase-related protein [Orrella sp. JC864]|uniref:enoyl-CoA hydratase-related protein n=1 Tax=Orrella sp. JC864 TaxID=3120298 RepID=UPI00300BDFF4